MNPRIEKAFITTHDTPFTAPEALSLCLCGHVYGHPQFPDGNPITTSRIVEANWTEHWVQTRNTRYEILSLDPGFVKYCEALPFKGKGTENFLRAVSSYNYGERL